MLKIIKFQKGSAEDPECTVVGFEFSANGRVGYKEYEVRKVHTENKTDEEIVDFAYAELKEYIDVKMAEFNAVPTLIGKTYTPKEITQ